MPRPSSTTATEFGGSPGLVQPATTPNGDPGHTPTPAELAMLERRGDPTGTRLPVPGDEDAILAFHGLDPLPPGQNP